MPKTIKITGTGKASVKPDLAELTLTLRTSDKDHGAAMEKLGEKTAALERAAGSAGFDKKELKTSDFHVNAEYCSIQENGVYKQVFKGYCVSQTLKLRFGLDSELLNKALTAVMGCEAAPELYISFLVKDADAFRNELLKSAAENAKKTAETLCAASGVKLGALISIDHSFSEAHFYSPTAAGIDCLRAAPLAAKADIEPENVSASENVTFIWEIE